MLLEAGTGSVWRNYSKLNFVNSLLQIVFSIIHNLDSSDYIVVKWLSCNLIKLIFVAPEKRKAGNAAVG